MSLTRGHTPGVHVNGGQILDQVEIELGQTREQRLTQGLPLLPAQTHPGVNHTELGEVGALAAHQHRVHVKLDTLQTELGKSLPSHTKSVSEKTRK